MLCSLTVCNIFQIKNVITINCGGTLDLVDLLQPDESVVFFILDSHRPYDLCNIYSESQICILGKPDEDSEIPEYNDIFRDDSVCNISCEILSPFSFCSVSNDIIYI